ncbi:DUF2971 domain-containing protein [Fusibacter ferrireducens]|uniref:DUF2971 domain-containing protein n=1 Tax=Fusibacter ferrireducens TaxID=2785058 RepID=A0ABS0A068_9FIRM|nr:DUF2971 domain-containing protein [Fusibacter ferrireducens]MBF4696080.1 DUF2971 domain-containing protein [Fusibacter ferrireducens]
MAYDEIKWRKRFNYRSDITLTLTHLTRETKEMSSVEVLIKILNEQKIIGSSNSGFIHGSNTAVCFQDAPQYGVAQNINHEKTYREELGNKVRYSHNGLVFLKSYVFKKGGRPVIYEKLEVAKEMLHEDEWWRIVNYDLSNKENIIDWTHEREWRVKGDFEFSLSQPYIILGNTSDYNEFMNKAPEEVKNTIAGITSIVTLIK